MIRINLLKPEKKEVRETPSAAPVEVKEKAKPPYFALLILLAIGGAVVLYFIQNKALAEEQAKLDAALQEKRDLQYVMVKIDELEQQKQLLMRKINLIKRLKAQQGSAVTIMDELSRNLPDWLWLTETNFAGDVVRIKGKSLSNNLLADYIFNLKESPSFTNVNLISSTLRRVRNSQYLEFSLTATFAPRFMPENETQNDAKGEDK